MNPQLSPGFLKDLRRPEYTGDNRCLPCTAVNLVLAAALTAAAAVVSPPAAVAVALVSLASIYLRGYLVPGTPELTRRHLPERVLAWFGKSEPRAPVAGTDFDVVSFLDRAAVVVDDGEDVALAPEFQTRLEAAARDLDGEAATRAAAAELLDVDADRLSFVADDAAWRVLLDGSILGRWESRAAFVTDLAADRALAAWSEEWASVPGDARGRTLSAIRACLEACPVCGGEIRLGTESVRSCCREYEVVAATCRGCDARLFETDARAVASVE
ncbi:hypothetical protein [Halobellus rufus]|uniref:hypothetical protein n=1 Tax=Halobellus rufus TaxID=1448860 RepID=UPI000679458D|nr:hypothetical protein [Halobellus rufus]